MARGGGSVKGDRELATLTLSLVDAMPACANDPRFIADVLTPLQTAEMRAICNRCPIVAECAAYAAASIPEAGFWAGIAHGTRSAVAA